MDFVRIAALGFAKEGRMSKVVLRALDIFSRVHVLSKRRDSCLNCVADSSNLPFGPGGQ